MLSHPNKRENNGEIYRALIERSSDQTKRRAYDLLAGLGPKVEGVEAKYEREMGWSPDRSTQVWGRPRGAQKGFHISYRVGRSVRTYRLNFANQKNPPRCVPQIFMYVSK